MQVIFQLGVWRNKQTMLLQRTRSIMDINQKFFAILFQSDRAGLCSKILSSKNILNELIFIDWEHDGKNAVAFLFYEEERV